MTPEYEAFAQEQGWSILRNHDKDVYRGLQAQAGWVAWQYLNAPPEPAAAPLVRARRPPYGCHNRAPLLDRREVQDGWTPDGRRHMRTISDPMTKECQYTFTALGRVDPGCLGCKWRAADEQKCSEPYCSPEKGSA